VSSSAAAYCDAAVHRLELGVVLGLLLGDRLAQREQRAGDDALLRVAGLGRRRLDVRPHQCQRELALHPRAQPVQVAGLRLAEGVIDVHRLELSDIGRQLGDQRRGERVARLAALRPHGDVQRLLEAHRRAGLHVGRQAL